MARCTAFPPVSKVHWTSIFALFVLQLFHLNSQGEDKEKQPLKAAGSQDWLPHNHSLVTPLILLDDLLDDVTDRSPHGLLDRTLHDRFDFFGIQLDVKFVTH